MIVVTAANGQLGTLVLEGVLKTVPATQIVAAVRNPEKAAILRQRVCRCVKPIIRSRKR